MIHRAGISGRLFRTHVTDRSEQIPGAGQPCVAEFDLCQSEIGDVRVSRVVDKDVGRFDVAMDHADRVGVIEGLADFYGKQCQRAIELRIPGLGIE